MFSHHKSACTIIKWLMVLAGLLAFVICYVTYEGNENETEARRPKFLF